jgi:mersacidin/lichenicidin family type 2 lantibiotic
MPTLEIVRAWKDEEYRDTLTEEQQAEMPEHPAGAIEFQEAEPEGENAFRPVRAGCFPLVAGTISYIPHTYHKGCRN